MSSSTPDTPADTTAAPAPAKKKKSKLMLIIAVVCAVALGCGGFLMYRTFAATPAKAEKSKKKRAARDEAKETSAEESEEAEAKNEKDKKKGDEHEEDSHGKSEPGGADALATSLPDDAEVKHIVPLEPFIVNLADEGDPRYLRVSVNLGTGEGEGGEEAKPDPLFTARVRNAMLSVLMTKRSSEILTVEGKTALRKELLRAAQAASDEPHVEAIYITDFIVQL